MRRTDRKVWAACESLDDLCEATQRWLRGEVIETPGHMGPPDPETAEITDDLLALNAAGFLTTGSQPGLDPTGGWDGRMWHQRAQVEGYATPALADRLRLACETAGLECHTERVADIRPPSWRDRLMPWRRRFEAYTPITGLADGSDWFTGCPHRLERADQDIQFGGIGDGAWDEVEASVRVTVIDPQWGARRELWDVLRASLASEVPA